MSTTPLRDRYVETNYAADTARAKYLAAKQALHEAEAEYDQAKEARNVAITARSLAYSLYVDACVAESCEAHTFDMWAVHGEPEGPLG